MTPYKFTQKGDTVVFHYKYPELKKFLALGHKDGNVGVIITKMVGSLTTYRGFGTIENPRNELMSISFTHFALFDGPLRTPEEICTPPNYSDSPLMNHKMMWIDMSENNGKPNIQTINPKE